MSNARVARGLGSGASPGSLARVSRVSRFVIRGEPQLRPESPEALFRSLRPTDTEIRHLWSHQADLLRDYQASRAADIALDGTSHHGRRGGYPRIRCAGLLA